MNRFAQYLFLIASGFACTSCRTDPESHAPSDVARFGTSTVGSTYYVIANGLGELLRKHAGIVITVEPIGGSHANVFGLRAGKIDYAITNSGAAYDSRHGFAPFDNPSDTVLIAQGQPSYRFMLVSRDEIGAPQDLEGKIFIGKRPALPEMSHISDALVAAADLTDVHIVSTKNTKESLRYMRSGTVSGIMIPGGAKVPSVAALFRDGLVDPLYVPAETIERMRVRLPAYMYTKTFPEGHFEGQEKEFTAFGLNTYLITLADAPEEQVYAIVKTLFENQGEFSMYHSEARYWTLEHTLRDPKIPFHPGAIRYFKEIGVWTKELEELNDVLMAAVRTDRIDSSPKPDSHQNSN